MWIFDRLTLRIFVIFLLTTAFFLIFIITIPNFDARNISSVSVKEQNKGIVLAKAIETELSKVPKNSFRWWMRFIVVMDNLKVQGQYFYVVTPSEQIISSDSRNLNIVRHFNEIMNQTTTPAKKVYDLQEILGPFPLKYSNDIYYLYIIQTAGEPQSRFANLIFDHPFLLLTLTMLTSTPLLLWLSWSLARPARRLKNAADQVARGNLQEWPELESVGSSEFKATGVSFNHMLRELKRMKDLQQRLLSDISHELRTPLTRLQLAASLSRRKYGENKETARIEEEAQKLDSMIGELLMLARQQYDSNETKAPYKIDKLFSIVIDDAYFEAEQLGKSFRLNQALSNDVILCYPNMICSALENVIRNAFRYSHNNIEIDFNIDSKYLHITVDDDGPGVPKEELQQIFRPFYRTSEARDRESGGTGLGLAIVTNAIIQNKGSVRAEKSDLGGLRIVLSLPLYTGSK